MYRVECYKGNQVVETIYEKVKTDALVYAEIMFNSGYTKVKVYDEDFNLIESF